ncbi:transporter [Nocardioides flavus (ex Wang et al. 2016)]|uniref:Transporter n=1 Tax=Nocardioides flavus (ex Wang et al. 2016) TaxID=2058780 RepID=A0ABQ3HM69_9ACTN|nr:LysE/ArgO family amino acid transporter [Nocardioides flavus (ex Wang et al. 2016)]GHE17769.1 transporter [Nocardioides flavus (ex Wang et al. 2016)]
MFQVVLTGLLTGLALIVAVGAQNAFLLRQAIRGEHVLPIVLTCLLSDVVAITAGVAGLGVVLERWPAVLPVAQVLGGVYLIGFGVHAAMRAWRPSALEAGEGTSLTVGRAVLLTLALTWLNPHFYLDAVLMLGTVANSFGQDRWWFLVGTLLASVLWFFGLGYGARLLRGLFARPNAWRVLDSTIAVLMGGLGVGLIAH